MCAPLKYEVDEKLGGEDSLKYLIEKAHSLGIEVFFWISTSHIGKESPLLKDHPDWIIKQRDGKGLTAGFWDLRGVSLKSTYRQYYLDKLLRLRKNTGLDGFWFDTYANFGCMSINYKEPLHSPQILALFEIHSELRKAGYKILLEGYSPFGLCASINGNKYVGQEYQAYKTSLGIKLLCPGGRRMPLIRDIRSCQHLFYRFIANKTPVALLEVQHLGGMPIEIILREYPQIAQEIKNANHDYNQVYQHMYRRRLLADDRGVIWRNKQNTIQILFSYKKFTYQLPKNTREVFDVTSEKIVKFHSQTLTTLPRHTYRIKLK
jgi:hypothetical protein